jgi:two-component system LytT family response regulator
VKVLVIEDDPAYRKFIVGEVQKIILDANISEASSVPRAIEIIHQESPALILSDIELDDKRISFEIFEEIGSLEGKVIFISSHDTFAMRAIKMSACDYILKPVDIEESHW